MSFKQNGKGYFFRCRTALIVGKLHHGGTEKQGEHGEEKVGLVYDRALSERVIKMAIDVHRQLGPGLLESTYEECLCFELRAEGMPFERQVALPIVYKTIKLDCAYRMDVVVEKHLVVEIKSVDRIAPIHEAQMLTYLRLSGYKVGLLMNFNGVTLKEGLRRFVV
jgi:GxxExxY protein